MHIWYQFGGKTLFLVVIVIATLVVQHLLVKCARKSLEASKLPSASILLNLLRLGIWSLACLIVLQPVFGIRPTGVVTALGVSSLFISLGMKDTVSNVVGGLALTITRVVIPGDTVEIGSVAGEVVDVNWRSTTVRDVQGNVQIIPNSVLNTSALTRLAPGSLRRFSLPLTIDSGAKLTDVEADIQASLTSALSDVLSKAFDKQPSSVSEQERSADSSHLAREIKGDFVRVAPATQAQAPIQMNYTGLTKGSIQATVIVHLKEDADIPAAFDKAVAALVNKEWLKD